MNHSINRNSILDLVKWIATISMVLDHLWVLFPEYTFVLRGIVRWAFPMFALMIAYNTHNAVQNNKTKTLDDYLKNLILFSFISEIPYQLYNQSDFTTFNIMPTLLLGFVFILLAESKRISAKVSLILLTTLTVFFSKFFMYGAFGVLLIILFYCIFRIQITALQKILIFSSGVCAVIANLESWVEVRGFTQENTYLTVFNFALNSFIASVLMSFLLLKSPLIQLSFKVPPIGKSAYWFYPIHLLVISYFI